MPPSLLAAVALVGCAATRQATPAPEPVVDPLALIETRAHASVEAAPPVDHEPFVLHGATVMTATGQVHSPGFVRVKDGRIEAVGAGSPDRTVGYTVLDVTGSVVTPGLIDTHSHLGVYPSPYANAHGDGNEATSPTTPGVWAEHSFWPQDPGLERAVAGGVTTLQILPGSANLIGGRGVVMHMHPALGARAMRFPGAPDTLKMACGENPKRVYGDRKSAPSTRMGNLRGQRAAYAAAQTYLEEWERYADALEKGEEDARAPARDLDKESLVGVLRGEILPQVHCYKADDMLSMLQVADEFGFQVRSFHHALEAYKIRDVLAERGVASSTWADWWGFKLEAYDGIPENLALLHEAGATAVVHSDSAEGIQRLNQEAAKALAAGRRAGVELTDSDALTWITANPAWVLGIEEQVGTLEVGKRADLVVWDGDPLSVYTRAHRVYVDGVLRHDAEAPGDPWSDFVVGQEVPR